MKSQYQKILAHLKKKKTITPMEALNLYGCFRLASRINEMRDDGIKILTTMIEDDGKHYAKYEYLGETRGW